MRYFTLQNPAKQQSYYNNYMLPLYQPIPHCFHLFVHEYLSKEIAKMTGNDSQITHPLHSTKTGDQISSSLKFLLIQKTICLMYLLDILKLKNLDLL